MDKGDFALIGCGGAGGNLVDNIAQRDARYAPYYLNTSKTDIQSLATHDDIAQNYYTISTQNGVGRDKIKGEAFARQRAYNMLDIMLKMPQETIYLVSSFSGGSGSSIISVLVDEISKISGGFTKKVNLIGILPSLKSPDIMLENAKLTWNSIMANKKYINSMIFVDNNAHIPNEENMKAAEKELAINDIFGSLFDRLFDIPLDNGTKFDSGNLGNILNDKGCLYLYDLPDDCGSFEIALSKAETQSVLCKMFTNAKNTIKVGDKVKIKCNYVGISTVMPQYNIDAISKKICNEKEAYSGQNTYSDNILLMSGCLPPVSTMKLIDAELTERIRNKPVIDDEDDNFLFSVTPTVTEQADEINNDSTTNNQNIVTNDNAVRRNTRVQTEVSPSRRVNELFRRKPRN